MYWGEIFTSDEVRPNIVPDLQLAARHYEISESRWLPTGERPICPF